MKENLNYEFVAIDLDDTLLDSSLKIPQLNKDAIKKAVDKGVLVTFATGRMFCSALSYARELELDLPLIAYHGALIKKTGGEEVLHHQPISMDIAREIASYCQKRDLHLNAYIDDTLYVAKENELTDYYIQIAGVPCQAVGDLVAFIEKAPTKLTVVVHDGEKADEVAEELDRDFGDEVEVTQSKKRFIEIINLDVSKGKAIEIVTGEYKVAREKTVGIGDSLNDLPMLRYCGLGICVANARPEVKEIADLEVESNDEAGVAKAIYRYVLSEDSLGGEKYGIR